MLQLAEYEVLDMARPTSLTRFTDLEQRVIQWLPSALSFGQIGEQLGVSGATVKVTAIGVYRKLGVDSRLEATGQCERLGLLRAGGLGDARRDA